MLLRLNGRCLKLNKISQRFSRPFKIKLIKRSIFVRIQEVLGSSRVAYFSTFTTAAMDICMNLGHSHPSERVDQMDPEVKIFEMKDNLRRTRQHSRWRSRFNSKIPKYFRFYWKRSRFSKKIQLCELSVISAAQISRKMFFSWFAVCFWPLIFLKNCRLSAGYEKFTS